MKPTGAGRNIVTIAAAALGIVGVADTGHAQPGRYIEAEQAVVPTIPASPGRHGLTAGASIGRGSMDISCDACADLDTLSEGFSVGAYGGWMLTPRLSIIGDAWMVYYKDANAFWFGDSQQHKITHTLVTGAAQFWISRNLWVRGGLGVARHSSDIDYRRSPGETEGEVVFSTSSPAPARDRAPMSSSSPAWRAGVGLELASNDHVAFDLQLNLGGSHGSQQDVMLGAFAVGLSWY